MNYTTITKFDRGPLARLLTGAGLAAALLTGCHPDQRMSASSDRQKQLYAYCMQCHQIDGGGHKLAAAPNIGGLDSAYVENQLNKWRDGVRGAHPDDAEGLRMRPMLRTLAGTDDIKVVAAYVASMSTVYSPPSLYGDQEKGGKVYQASCASCHGTEGLGNQAMMSPRLAGRNDWYLVTQLHKFRSGVRGADPRDAQGAMMRPMALGLADEQTIRDVAVYLSQLKPKEI
ncbi:MAG: c-type cytochrome [Candidatus Sericytochromatia bacterium]|nr:c-type cytochrome [Candidatus Tanganyikabacteria bacterium]